jgi:hypothetical protein
MDMPRPAMQRGSGYPGMWKRSNVTQWVNGEAPYVRWRDAFLSAATPFLRAAE